MEITFATQLEAWNPFYSAVAGTSATLVGLLFVSLALRPHVMGNHGPKGMRTIAGQTFHSFLMVLTIALIALVPDTSERTFAVSLTIIGVWGIIRTVRDSANARTDPDPQWGRRAALTRSVSPAVAYTICTWVGLAGFLGDASAIDWLVAAVFTLVISAAAACWDLLRGMGEWVDDSESSSRP
ncbi:MAG: hypothetical protein IT337_12755 [Thermomicrobiales bacterium]|nr:hypothetical protein [Thermomicrobiales bacterium]